MDSVSAALIGYGLSRTLDGLFTIGGQGRALRNALGRSLARFRDRYPDVMDLILADEAWELFQEELKLLVTADQHPDATRLARRLAGDDAEKARRFQVPLSELFQWVRNEAALEPKLVGLQNFRIGEEVVLRLAGIEEALGIRLNDTEVLAKAREATNADIEAFQTARGVHDYWVPFELKYSTGDGRGEDVGLDDIVQLICAGQRILLEGRPGFGKTTAALRIAKQLTGNDHDVVPLFIPLAEWSVSRRDFFEEIASRREFSARTLSARHMQFLAEKKRIVLVLDGWNELTGEKLERVHAELRKFLREHPTVGMVVTMRPTVQRPPIKYALAVTVPSLDRDQRDAVITARLGDRAGQVIDRIRRQRDLDEITRIPLYLSTYLRVTAADFTPRSKEELLRAFVRSHESSEEHELPLGQALRGFHDEFLQDLAVRMLTGGGPALSGQDARQVVSRAGDRLIDASQIAPEPDPSNVLLTLVAHHLLVATGEGDELAYSFQHQQFQEWFASRYVEDVILKAVEVAGGDSTRRLREQIIDIPLWEEPTLFALERLVGKGATGGAAVAFVIELALQIDPMFAAKITFQCGEGVWRRVRDVIIDFARRWHRDGAVDRALGFMIATGRPEFSDVVWPYLGHDDMQVRLGTLRKAEPFRPGVLGEDWLERLSDLSEEAQKNLLYEMVIDGGVEGTALAEEAAAGDVSDSAKTRVIEALDFRHAFTQMDGLLANASAGVWRELARRGRLEWMRNEATRLRIVEEKRQLADAAPRGTARARILLDLAQMGVEEVKPELIEEIRRPDFELDRDTFHILESAASVDAEGVSAALVERMIQGLPLGWYAGSFLREATEEQKREIFDRILDGRIGQRWYDEAASVLGQEQIANLVERFLETAAAISQASGQVSKELREQYWKWQKAIASTNLSALLDVIIAREPATTIWEINALAKLLSRHGGRYDRDARLAISDRHKGGVCEMLDRWVDLLSGSPAGNRYVMSSVADVLERIGTQETLDTLVRLLDLELAQQNADDDAFCAWIEGGQRGSQPKEARTGTASSYRRAFEAIPGTSGAEAVLKYLDDADFGPDAAQILRHVGLREAGLLEESVRFSRWPDYSRIRERQQLRSEQTARPDPHPYAAAIMDAGKRVVGAEPDQENLARAVKLCVAASGLEYGNRLPEMIEVLERSDAHRKKIGCFLNLILAGENLPADLIEPGCEAAFQKWREQRWHQENDWWQLEDWLVVQALSDDPQRLLGRIESLEAAFRRPRNHEEIVRALGESAHAQAADVLVRLGEMIPDLKVSHAWIKGAAERAEAAVTNVLMDMLWDEETSARLLQSHHDGVFSSALAARIREHEGSRRTLKDRLREALAGPVRELSLQVVEHLGDEELVLAALNQISDTSPDHAPYHLRQAIENIVTSRVPAEDWPSAYSIVPANASRLRASLFRMAYEDPGRRRIAQALLEWTDEMRDEYGRPDDEPRHPDIGSGRQWPMLP